MGYSLHDLYSLRHFHLQESFELPLLYHNYYPHFNPNLPLQVLIDIQFLQSLLLFSISFSLMFRFLISVSLLLLFSSIYFICLFFTMIDLSSTSTISSSFISPSLIAVSILGSAICWLLKQQ